MAARVLIIKDDLPIADLLGEALRHGEGAPEVLAVATAAAGLERIRHGAIDCVLLGSSLPDCDGLECLERIRERWPELPVIMLTAEGSEDVAVEAMKRGATDCVVKQRNDLAGVVAAVREAIAKRESGRARLRLTHGVFVGRLAERAMLREAVEASLVGRGGLLLIEGEAGIGKTTLAQHGGAYAEGRGMRAVWGRCHQAEGAPPFWLWIQILRGCMQDSSDEDLRADLGADAGTVAQILPELATRLGDVVDPPACEPEQARFRLFDGVTGFLKKAARRRPTMIVLDDVHWADASSLLLLDFLGRELGNAGLLVLCAYRDLDLADNEPAGKVIARLRGQGSTLRLLGLSEAEVKEQIGAISSPQKVPGRFAHILFRRSDGNPFFVEEILRLLLAEGVLFHDGGRWTAHSPPEEMPIPRGAREILARRLAHVSPECREVLSVAAVIGRHFDLDAVAHLSAQSADRLYELLDEAAHARLIARLHGPVRDYTFCQALVRGMLYQELPALTRADLHHRMGEYIEGLHAAHIEPQLSALVYHFRRSAVPSALAKARDYALRAGARAAALVAHEEAARYFEIALKTFATANDGESARRYEILLRTSECWWRAGESEPARRAAQEAAAIARAGGSPADLARAALAYAGQLPGFGAVVCDRNVVQLLEEALAGLGEDDCGLRARLMGRLAEEIIFSGEPERRQLLGQQAVEMARRSGDPGVLASVLKNMHWALWTPEKVEDRLALADEVVQLAGNDQAMRFEGRLFRCFALLELADLPAAEEEMAVCARLAFELRQPYCSWLVDSARACFAFTQGRLDDIPELARRALESGEHAQNPNAALHHDVQLCHLYWQRGEFAALAQVAQRIGSDYPLLNAALQCGIAVTLSEEGLAENARSIFESFAIDDFARLPRDVTWVSNLTHLAQVCATLGEAKSAATLYNMLLPFEHRVVVLAPFVTWGVACHFLGQLAATMGKGDLARCHYEEALTISRRLGMAQSTARTELAYAQLLTARGEEGERVAALLDQSLRTSEKLRMALVAERVRALQTAAETRGDRSAAPNRVDPPGARGSKPASCEVQIRREGKYWTLTRGDRVIRLARLRGMDYLVCLLRRPNRAQHVIDLDTEVCGVDPSSVAAHKNYDEGPDRLEQPSYSDPLIDASYSASLRARLQELGQEIEEADRNNDFHMASERRRERDQIEDILKKAYGMGHSKKFTDRIERLRVKIRKAIKKVIDTIAADDPNLADYVSRAVKTGTSCIYKPDPSRPFRWTF